MTTRTIIKPFDSYEIHGVHEFNDDGRKFCEQIPDDQASFWTLYGHIPGEGAMAIGDFGTREHAEEAFQRITGIPFAGTREVQDRIRMMHAGPRLLEALETAQSRLLWARDLAGNASELVMLDNRSEAQEMLDEIKTSEYTKDDLDAISPAITEVTGRVA